MSDLSKLKGVGIKKEDELNKLGIYNILDLLNYYPRTYEQTGEIKNISKCKVGEKSLVKCQLVKSLKPRRIRHNLNITKIKFISEGSIFYATFFNNPYIYSYFKEDEEYKLYGKINGDNGYKEMISPKYAKLNDENTLRKGLNSIYPLSKKSKITNKELNKFIREGFNFLQTKDVIPSDIKEKYGLVSINEAYKNIHFPNKIEDAIKANERISFDEFCGFTLSIILNRNLNLGKQGFKFKIIDKEKFLSSLPFSLTSSQEKVIQEIEEDITSGVNMNRLIQGDVGSGKTVVSEYAIYESVKNGYQAALCAPTKVLAFQHYENLKKLFNNLNMKCELLHSDMSQKEKREAYERIENGSSDIIIGTHAVFSKNLKYNNLGLAVIDEQHRFGVAQRGFLSKKGERVHTLVMSATPIPRTLTLSLYNDLDVSIIKNKPEGRKDILTYYRDYSYEDRAYKFALKQVAEGGQVYIVCPAIDSEDTEDVTSKYKELSKTYFKNLNVGLVHGKLKEEEKDYVMNLFYNKQIDILIATTVIEVGIDSKDATLIIIEGSERFGLATLHQLRGRVGRNNKQSYCILLSKSESKESIKRLKFLEKTNDGFEVARYDLKMRGTGDILGYRQSGKSGYDIYKLIENSETFNKSKEAMEDMLNDASKENMNYIKYIKDKYSYITKDVTWN